MLYGTIARFRVKPGKETEMARLTEEEAPQIPGFVFQHVYKMDADPQEYLLVVAFQSREAYRANAESPEQHARYQGYVSLLETAPVWHDGEIVASYPV